MRIPLLLLLTLPPALGKVISFSASARCRKRLRECVAHKPLTCSVVCSNDQPSEQNVDLAERNVVVTQPAANNNEPPLERFGDVSNVTQGAATVPQVAAAQMVPQAVATITQAAAAAAAVSTTAPGLAARLFGAAGNPATQLTLPGAAAARGLTTAAGPSLVQPEAPAPLPRAQADIPAVLRTAGVLASEKKDGAREVTQEGDYEDEAQGASDASVVAPVPMIDRNSVNSVEDDQFFGVMTQNESTTTTTTTAAAAAGWFGRRRRQLEARTLELPYLQAVGEVLANRETDNSHMTVLRTEGAGERVIGLLNGAENSTAVCEEVCVDRRLQECVLANVCEERLTFVESWNVTHFCLANDGDTGGWAFRLPLSVALNATGIDSMKLSTEIFPATEARHTFQSSAAELTLSLASDAAPQYDDTMLRRCSIESLAGVPVSVALTATGKEDGSQYLDFELATPAFTAAQVANNSRADAQFSGLIEGSKLLVALTAPTATISNGGLVPPPFDNTNVTITHHLW